MFASLALFSIRHRLGVLLVTGLLWLVALLGALRLTLDFSSTSFYGGDGPLVEQLHDFHEQWGLDDNQFVVVLSAQASNHEGMLHEDRLAVVEDISRALASDPMVERVISPTSLPRLPGTEITPLNSPGLLSEDLQQLAIVVELELSSDDLQALVPVVDRLKITAERYATPLVHLGYGGLPSIRAAFFSLTIHDQLIFVPLTLVLVGLGLYLAFRRLHGLLIPAAAAATPTLFLLGVMGWTGESIGLLNQAYFTLLPVLAVADSIHLLARIHENSRDVHTHHDSESAVVLAFQHVGSACLLTTLTTALGFASLASSSMPILRGFGLYASVGMVLAFLTLALLLPALLSFVPPASLRPRSERRDPSSSALLARTATLATTRPGRVLLVTILITLLSGWLASQLVVDNKIGDLLQADHPVHLANNHLDQSLGGSLSLEVDVRGDFSDSEQKRALERFSQWAEQQDDFLLVISPSTVPLGRINKEHDRAHLSLRTADIGGKRFEALVRASELQFKALAPSLAATFTGTSYVAYHGVNRITEELRRSLSVVFLVILALIGLLFRSLKIALITILPNLLPFLFSFALLALAKIDLDPLGAVIATMALGVAVDDTIHLLRRMKEGQALGLSLTRALQVAIQSSGRAATITSLVLALGLSVNLLSSFPPMALLGALGALVILFALLADLLVLPALLTFFLAEPPQDDPAD